MTKGKQRQALATTARLSSQIAAPEFASRAFANLEAEAARIVAEGQDKRLNGKTSLHIVGQGGVLSGVIKDARTTVRFAGGAVAITTRE